MNSLDPTDPDGPARRTPGPRRAVRLPDIDTRRCTGCGRCVAACDLHLLSLETVHWEKSAVLHEAGRCTGCSLCALNCPFSAITLRAFAADETREVAGRPRASSA